MGTRLVLLVTEETDKYLESEAKKLGISKLDYIRFIINKDRENKKWTKESTAQYSISPW